VTSGARRAIAMPALAGVLFALCVGYLARVTRFADARVELRAEKITVVTGATRERLARLDADVLLSYYVTAREDMPAEFAYIEDQVVLVLEALEQAADGRIAFQVVDPASEPELTPWLDAHDLSTFAARRVERDGWVEEEVWSSLHIAYGGRAGAAISELGPAHVPHLISLIVAHLDQLEEPRAAHIAVDGIPPDYFTPLGVTVDAVDFETTAVISADADIFFWAQPEVIDPRHLSAVADFLASGGSVVVAASQVRVAPATHALPGLLHDVDLTPLLSQYGLRPQVNPVFDVYCEERRFSDPPEPAPYSVRCIAPNQDFRSMSGQPNGTLVFRGATTFTVDGARLAAIGRRANILATTSNLAWLPEILRIDERVSDIVNDNVMPPATGLGAKYPLAVQLESTEPGQGDLVFLGSVSPFSSRYIDDEAYAHQALLKVIVRTLASSERLATRRSSISDAARVGELNAAARAGWQSFSVLLVPALLGMLAFFRSRRGRQSRVRGKGSRRMTVAFAGALVGLCLLAALLPSLGSDWTADGRNQLAPETEAILGDVRGDLSIELCFSPAAELPAEWRPPIRLLADLANEFASRSSRIRVQDLGAEESITTAIAPVQVTSLHDEVTTVRHISAAVRITGGEADQILRFDSLASFEDAEFRILTAIQRAAGVAQVHVAVACDIPRLSPAEALLEYQRKGLFAPTGADIYAAARGSLERLDFRVSYVDPGRPEIPGDADYLVWLQPRRDARAMTTALSHYLSHGGQAFVAVQHYDVVQKELEAEGQASPWWPQPQFPDVDELYFKPLGIDLAREVLFDQLSSADGVAFDLRAVASGYGSDEVLRGLGDLALPSANRIAFDDALLAANGLTATNLISTSRAWSVDWRGGALSQADLSGADASRRLDAPGALLARIEGRFKVLNPETGQLEVDAHSQASGSLLLLGCSKALQDEHLDADARNDHLLQNAVTYSALGEQHLRILARRPVARGFEFVDTDTRLIWRAVALGLGPLLVALFGLLWGRTRRAAA